jgi:hypothetical protein
MAMHPQLQAEAPNRPGPSATSPYDYRFRRLIPNDAWRALRPAIRHRFSRRLEGTAVAIYAGEVVETGLSAAGWLLAQLCRLIGAPLPLHREAGVPAVVVVSEDLASGGQRWTRVYHRRRGAPQVINSAKTFAGPTGLEELIGGGIGMALWVEAAEDRISFVSSGYFLKLGRRRLPIPGALCPGRTTVTHRDLGDGAFAFDLEVVHPWFGALIHQHALFRDQ